MRRFLIGPEAARSRAKCMAVLTLVGLVGLSRAAAAQTATPAAPPPSTAATPVTPADPTTGAPQSATPVPAAPQQKAFAEFTTLRILRDKRVISQAEYDSAMKDLGETTGLQSGDATSLVIGKWATTMYGFVEADNIFDTTQSFNDLAGNGQVARAGTLRGDNGRFTMGVRNSRIGFRLKAPEVNGIRTSAQLEMDFLGNQPAVASSPGAGDTGTQPYYGSEGAFFTNPAFRVRHANVKIETPVVDVLIGQYWQLYGWQSVYHPNTVEIQGVPGQLYSRTPQVRISKSIKSDAVTFEMAAAMTRPVQRDSALPEGQGGLRLALNNWTGLQTMGATGTQISPASIAATGYVRRVSVAQWAAAPTVTNDKTASGFALDGYIPIIPATKDHKDNALSVNGELAYGYGSADFYTGLGGGIGFPALPNPKAATPAPAYQPNIDQGIATYDVAGGLHFIQWQSYLLGAQYYLPGVDGRVWVSANYSHMSSDNMQFYGNPAKARSALDWFDVNLFGDVTTSVRLGLEYANFNDQYIDGTHAINHRFQGSAFYIF